MNPHTLRKVRSRTMLDAVATFPCALRVASIVPGGKCAPQNTVVPAHLPVFGKGTGTKVSDLFVVAACRTCHDILDARNDALWWIMDHHPTVFQDRILRGYCETLARLVEAGIIKVKGDET